MNTDRYRGYAAECLFLAAEMKSPGTKAMLVEMAQNWLALAAQAEKNARTGLIYEPVTPKLRIAT